MQDLTILTLLKRLQDKVNALSKQAGPKGDRGPAGKDGVSIKGEKGDTGEMGVGQDGRDGEEGPAGKDGEDGVGISGVTLGIDDSIIFQLSNGDEASVELPLIQGSGDTIINKVNGGSGATAVESNTGEWKYDASTSSVRNGFWGTDTGALTDSTVLRLSKNTGNGTDVTGFLLNWLKTGAVVYIQDKSVSSNSYLVTLDSVGTDQGDHVSFTIGSSITLTGSFSNNTSCLVLLGQGTATTTTAIPHHSKRFLSPRLQTFYIF